MEGTNLNNALNEVGKLITDKLKAKASEDGFSASGNLSKSFTHKALADELTIFGARYAEALSSGIKTGTSGDVQGFKDMQLNIIKWAKMKGIKPKKARGVIKESDWKSLGFVMSRSIRKKGISKRFGYKGSGFIQSVKSELESKITDIIFQGYKKDLEEQLEIITNKK